MSAQDVSAASSRTVVALAFFGQAVLVDAREPRLADAVRTLWQPFVSPGLPATDAVRLTVPSHDSADSADSAVHDLGWLNSALNRTAMELTAHLAVHAGVVRRGDVVIAFPARSGVGKSTLTGACLRAGFDYVSDEALCLGYDNHLVQPYPRPLGLSSWSAHKLAVTGASAGHDVLVLPRDFGAASTSIDELLCLTHIVLPRRIDGANGVEGTVRTAATLAPAPAHEAIEALLLMSFNHYRRPADAVRLVASVVAAARVSVLTYDDAVEAAALVAEAFVAKEAPAANSPTNNSPLVEKLPHA